jgi:hypothetical protein
MHFAYIDESGDPGPKGSLTYVLAVVLVDSRAWAATFDELIDFRRYVNAKFGVPVRAEIKANHLLQNHGAFRPLRLSERARHDLYRAHMRLQPKLGLSTFAIVMKKASLAEKRADVDPRDVGWEYMLQRLERFTTKGGEEVLIMHDEGDAQRVRKLARKARRAGSAGSAFGTGILRRPATRVIDDPVPRVSSESYFLQLADLNAYAAFRRIVPPPERRVQIVPRGMWDELGDARFLPVNRLSGGPRGIVRYP